MSDFPNRDKIIEAINNGTARIIYHGNWKQRLEREVFEKSMFESRKTWELRVLKAIFQPHSKSGREQYYSDGLDIHVPGD